jgi:hypothetical protein
MSRFARFAPNADQFVTSEEQAAALLARHERKRRPYQLPPVNSAAGRQRRTSSDGSQRSGDHQSAAGQKQPPSQEYQQRVDRRQQGWLQRRDANRSSAVSHHPVCKLADPAGCRRSVSYSNKRLQELHSCTHAAVWQWTMQLHGRRK